MCACLQRVCSQRWSWLRMNRPSKPICLMENHWMQRSWTWLSNHFGNGNHTSIWINTQPNMHLLTFLKSAVFHLKVPYYAYFQIFNFHPRKQRCTIIYQKKPNNFDRSPEIAYLALCVHASAKNTCSVVHSTCLERYQNKAAPRQSQSALCDITKLQEPYLVYWQETHIIVKTLVKGILHVGPLNIILATRVHICSQH